MKHLIKTSRKLTLVLLCLTTLSICAQDVYVTRSGTKFHKENCRYLRTGATVLEQSKALSRGFTACSVCKPDGKNMTDPPPGSATQCTATTKAKTRCKRNKYN